MKVVYKNKRYPNGDSGIRNYTGVIVDDMFIVDKPVFTPKTEQGYVCNMEDLDMFEQVHEENIFKEQIRDWKTEFTDNWGGLYYSNKMDRVEVPIIWIDGIPHVKGNGIYKTLTPLKINK